MYKGLARALNDLGITENITEKHIPSLIKEFINMPTILNPTGTAITTCSMCGYEYGQQTVALNFINHNTRTHNTATNVWEYDNDYHWNPCMGTIGNEDTFKEYIKTNLYRCAHYENKALHDYDEGVVIKEPTETESFSLIE